jgi:hypothetical protein
MARQRETPTQSAAATVLGCIALLKFLILRLLFEGHRETVVIPHVQNTTRLYPDRVIMDFLELKSTALHSTAQSAHVPMYCV